MKEQDAIGVSRNYKEQTVPAKISDTGIDRYKMSLLDLN